jgi:hypothetical protein
MSLNPIETARERLLSFRLPERGIEYDAHGFPVKRHDAEKLLDRFAALAAGFARAREAAGADEELKSRSALFEELTAPGTAFDKARRSAYEEIKRAVEPFKLPDGSFPGKRGARARRKVSLTGPSLRPSGWELIADDYPQVERFVGDLDSIAWHLPEALAYADRLVGLVPSGPGGTSLRRWRDELFKLATRVDGEQLLGCRLIVRCRETLDERGGDYEKYEQLLGLLVRDAPRLVTAVQDAAGVLSSMAVDKTGGEDAQEPAPTLTFSIGERDYTLEAEGRPPVSLPADAKPLITLFIQKIKVGSPSEDVPFRALHVAIGDDHADERRASPQLRQVVLQLNTIIREAAGPPPRGGRHFITTKGIGIHLNPSMRWELSEALRELFGYVWDHPTDPRIIQEAQPQRDQQLPARSRGGIPIDHENDDPAG